MPQDGEQGEQAERARRLAEQVAGVWTKFRGEILEQAELVIFAAEALGQGTLSEEERAKAQHAAHNLSGSVGTFGFWEGSKVAKRIELQLKKGTELSAEEIREVLDLAGNLHEMLQ
ncbi:MAG: Hpt domain-containing protein, partial [Actinomycetota bacterium]|nr:Hpt domain-containing protein [Actinomycetota bacterium]